MRLKPCNKIRKAGFSWIQETPDFSFLSFYSFQIVALEWYFFNYFHWHCLYYYIFPFICSLSFFWAIFCYLNLDDLSPHLIWISKGLLQLQMYVSVCLSNWPWNYECAPQFTLNGFVWIFKCFIMKYCMSENWVSLHQKTQSLFIFCFHHTTHFCSWHFMFISCVSHSLIIVCIQYFVRKKEHTWPHISPSVTSVIIMFDYMHAYRVLRTKVWMKGAWFKSHIQRGTLFC
jgi:hypothetical protein